MDISFFADPHIVIYTIIGVVAGIAAGFFGMGGGSIIVPIMLMLHHPIHHAIGVSAMQMIFSSIIGSATNYKKGLLDINDGIYAGLGGLIGACFSGIILMLISAKTLTILFLCIMACSFIKYALKIKSNINSQPPVTTLYQQRVILLFTGMVTGIFAISLGIGGGLLMAPILGYFLGYSSKKVAPLGLFFVIFSSISGTISFHYAGVIDSQVLQIGFYVGIFSIVGVWIGIRLVQAVSVRIHRNALLLIYLFSMFVTAYKLITG